MCYYDGDSIGIQAHIEVHGMSWPHYTKSKPNCVALLHSVTSDFGTQRKGIPIQDTNILSRRTPSLFVQPGFTICVAHLSIITSGG